MKRLLSITLVLMCAWTWADQSKEVHVYQQTSAGGVMTQLSDQTLMTGSRYSTVTAPKLAGYVFTHWSISRTQTFVNRDRLGRALDLVTFDLYEETTLTANYLPESQDSDNDSIADGWEIYWYGSLAESALSDSDHDGLTFAQELAAGTNPLMPNESQEGGIVWDEGGILQYNPTGLQSYTIRSEPEGELFATITDFVEPGTSVTTPTCNRLASNFAYWTRDGVRVQDRRGRAVDGITFSMPTQTVEFVAVCISDGNLREQYYWYGTEVGMSSDTDGDGMTLVQEIAAGTNPLMPNESLEGGIVWDQGVLLQYNPEAYKAYTIRSEPEGELFATQTDIVRVGTALTSPLCSHSSSKFAYWTLNGVRQQDRHGRALDQVAFVMPSNEVELVAVCVNDSAEREQIYWYGASTGMDSDTDGDGMTLAQEIAAGTNPLIANESLEGGIVWDQGELLETDLQVYEQAKGTLVGGSFSEVFTSPIAGNADSSVTFNAEVCPAVVDYNADGIFDMIIATKGGILVYRNQGYAACPDFVQLTAAEAGLSVLDAAIVGMSKPLLCGDGTNGVYFSDNGGRIYKYAFESKTITDMEIDGVPGVLDASDWAASAPMRNGNLVHRWSFNGNLRDSITGRNAIQSGNVTSDGTKYTLGGGSRGSSCINLGANVLPTNGSPVTIELWATQHSVKNWSRIFDFGRNSSDFICMTWTEGTTLDRAVTRVTGIGDNVSGLAPYSLNVEYHIALVFEPQGDRTWKITAYKQDAHTGVTLGKITFASSLGWSLASQSQDNCYLGRSFFSADNDASASYNEVRIWNKALSESELTHSAILGADYEFIVESPHEMTANGELVVLGSDGNLNSLSGDKAYTIDTPIVDGISIGFADVDHDGLNDLLASDAKGHIWLYSRTGEAEFTLQHKVWGGTFDGFANGLTIAPVDWEDDGDVDALVGTADGKLMLLRDPKVGRPTNLKALAGVDNVLLTWDPNQQSRIRGYRVYRDDARIAQTPLPTYRDFPAVAEDGDSPEFAYKVSSVSRFYTAGNSTPTETESMPTEAVTARLGGVKFFWNDAVAKVGEQVAVMLSIENSMNYNVAGKTEVVAYDPEYLTPVKVVKTGLTEECVIEESHHEQAGASPAGEWQVTITGAVGGGTPTLPAGGQQQGGTVILPAGGGKFLMFVFEAKKEGVTTVGGGTPTLPAGAYATVSIAAAMASAPYQLGDVDGDGDVDVEDLRLLAKLKNGNGRKPTANQLKAGDFNGNGKLDNADYQALREQLKEKRIL